MSKTFANATAHPLQWPQSIPRSKMPGDSQFSTSLFQALENVQDEIRRFGENSGKKVTDLVISSNYTLSDTKPKDGGVAVYFTWDGERTCIAVDKYRTVEENLQAIYHCISAERTKLRHGGINLVKAAFRGYAALPDPNYVNWRDTFSYPEGSDLDEVKSIYRKLCQKHHPDRDGNVETFNIIQKSWELARAELGERH